MSETLTHIRYASFSNYLRFCKRENIEVGSIILFYYDEIVKYTPSMQAPSEWGKLSKDILIFFCSNEAPFWMLKTAVQWSDNEVLDFVELSQNFIITLNDKY